MSQPISITTLKYIKPASLATTLSNPSTAPTTAIIDVRDHDHLGGHIKSSQWIPAHEMDARMPELLRVNKDKTQVVFHCMLSQQRGPTAALAYARARAEEVRREKGEAEREEMKEGKIGGQEICVLEGGFENWVTSYGKDEKLTEGFERDLWDV